MTGDLSLAAARRWKVEWWNGLPGCDSVHVEPQRVTSSDSPGKDAVDGCSRIEMTMGCGL